MSDNGTYAADERVSRAIDLCIAKGVPCEIVEWMPDGSFRIGKAPIFVTVVQNAEGPLLANAPADTPQNAFDQHAADLYKRAIR